MREASQAGSRAAALAMGTSELTPAGSEGIGCPARSAPVGRADPVGYQAPATSDRAITKHRAISCPVSSFLVGSFRSICPK